MEVKNINEVLEVVNYYKKSYNNITTSFFNKKKEIEEKRKWKEFIYSLKGDNIYKTKRNAIWLYMNDDITYDELKKIIKGKIKK